MRDTSILAHESIKPHKPSMKERICAFIGDRGDRGATNFEIADELDMKIQSVTPRVTELARDCRVADSGNRRDSGNGRMAAVWKATALIGAAVEGIKATAKLPDGDCGCAGYHERIPAPSYRKKQAVADARFLLKVIDTMRVAGVEPGALTDAKIDEIRERLEAAG